MDSFNNIDTSIYEVPLEIDMIEVSQNLIMFWRKNDLLNNRLKIYFSIFKLYNQEEKYIKKEWLELFTQCNVDEYLHELNNIGVIDFKGSDIKLKYWNRRKMKIIPRNFVKIIKKHCDLNLLLKEYDMVNKPYLKIISTINKFISFFV